MAPFIPGSSSTTRVTAGVASANVAVVAGRQMILSAPIGNSDIVYVEFGASNAIAAVVPVAAGAKGGMPILPGSMIEITVPAGQAGFVNATHMAYISGTAAQDLLLTEGNDA